MAKKASRARSVKAPKVQGSVPPEKIDRAIRVVAFGRTGDAAKSDARAEKRAAAGKR